MNDQIPLHLQFVIFARWKLGCDLIMSNSGEDVCTRIYGTMPQSPSRSLWQNTEHFIYWTTSLHHQKSIWRKCSHCDRNIGPEIFLYTQIYPSKEAQNVLVHHSNLGIHCYSGKPKQRDSSSVFAPYFRYFCPTPAKHGFYSSISTA